MKVTPRPYYQCDYCTTRSDSKNGLKYTDNSGLNNKCYDMCSDECLQKHANFLETEVFSNPSNFNLDLANYSLDEYLKDQIITNYRGSRL